MMLPSSHVSSHHPTNESPQQGHLCRVFTCIGRYSDEASSCRKDKKDMQMLVRANQGSSFTLQTKSLRFLPYWHVRSRHLGWELPAKSLVLSLWSAMICQELEHCPFMCTLEALQMLFWCASAPPSHERIHLPWKKDGGPRWLPQLLWWVVKWPCQQTLTSPWTAMLLYLYLVRSVLAYIPLQPKSWRADPFKTFWLPTSGWFPTTLFTLSSLPTQCILQSGRIEQRLNECNGLIAYLRQSSLAIALSWKTA